MAEWMTVREAVELSGYDVDYIRERIRAGKIKARKVATVWLVSRRSLLTYLKRVERERQRDRRYGAWSRRP